MRFLITLFLRVNDLVEAQGRVARRAAFDIVIAFAVMLTAAALGILTCSAAAGAVLVALQTVMPLAAALALVACMLAMLTVGAAIVSLRFATPRGAQWPR